MKKIIALMMTVALVLSLSACFMPGSNNGATSDQAANAADVSTYDKDFDGLVKYITDRISGTEKMEIYYDLVGADNGVRIVLNKNAFVEVYDYSSLVEGGATADSTASAKAQSIIDDIKDDEKFKPLDNSADMTAAITSSGKYVLAWDPSRGYDYAGKVVTDELKENW